MRRAKKVLKKYRKTINPPYKRRDLPIIIGTVVILFAIPLTVLLTQNTRDVNIRAAAPNGKDLDVTYIERTPRYYRYCVEYPNDVPTLCPGTENQKRWPSVGETVTYTAHIINKGNEEVDSFSYQFLVDDVVVDTGNLGPIQGHQELTVSFNDSWTAVNKKIEFKVDSEENIIELSDDNNSLSIGSHDLAISIWVESGQYSIFNNTPNLVGSYSFEDWIQAQFDEMNSKFAQAKYPTSPDGIKDRVGIDKIVVANDLDGQGSPSRSDPHEFLLDGRWIFSDGDSTNQSGLGGVWQTYTNNFVNGIDGGLIHELAHQLGVIDLYRLNLNNDPDTNNGFQVKNLQGQVIDVSELPTFAWNQVLFQHQGIMGGGDTSPYNSTSYFESHTAAGMNSHQGFRRGYYGEYLFDTPEKNYVEILDTIGNPLVGAQVQLFQKNIHSGVIDNNPEISLATNDQGLLLLPNRPVTEVTTATGHTLKPNPFGQVGVVGQNGTMFVRVVKDNKESYGWLLLHDLNLAYWSGNQEEATFTIKTNIDPRIINTENLTLNKPTTSNRDDSLTTTHYANDGDKTTQNHWWQLGNPINPGDWWQVDLGQDFDLGRLTIYPSAINSSDFCDTFSVHVSTNGSFSGEEVKIIEEDNTPHKTSVSYSFATTSGRYVRLVCENNQSWIRLQEIEIFSVDTSNKFSTLTIDSPENGSAISKTAGIQANISSFSELDKLEVYVGNSLKKTVDSTSLHYSWDTSLVKNGSYFLTAKAYDNSGAVGSYSINVKVSNGKKVLNIKPSSDATLARNYPNKRYGRTKTLVADKNPLRSFLMKFSIKGIGERTVESAKLRLRNVNRSNLGGVFYQTRTLNWTERSVRWSTKPPLGRKLAALKKVQKNKWYTVDLTKFIKKDGTFSIRAISNSRNGAAYFSKEAGSKYAPRIIVTVK